MMMKFEFGFGFRLVDDNELFDGVDEIEVRLIG